jgi:two-component system nitrogen regulation response regulator GlnG
LPVIIMTAFSDLDSAVSAFQGGAFEYLAKPFDVPKAVDLIRRAVAERQRQTPQADQPPAAAAPEMLGQAPAMQDVFRGIGRLSASNAAVLITGESGTGKKLAARALHKHSSRAGGPFVTINAAAIPKELLEIELFGRERSTVHGTQGLQRGRLEQADGGTLFLDEISDMPLELQTRLLRVLSDGEFYRVGGHSPIKANVRMVAATREDLGQRAQESTFREDLLHRLNVIHLHLPPLRERREDIPALAHHFMQQSAHQLGVEPKSISSAALTRLAGFGFPGNVRQLENICYWLTVMAPAQAIDVKDLPPEVLSAADAAANMADGAHLAAASHIDAHPAGPGVPEPAAHAPLPDWEGALQAEAARLLAEGQFDVWDQLVGRVESRLIRAALANTHGRRAEAAERLGIGRNTITRKIRELGLD